MVVNRMTIFKVPDPANVPAFLEAYDKLKDAKKDGKNYILSAKAYQTAPDPRNQGYTVVGETKFASKEDMVFYDEQCEGHAALKATAKGKISPPPLVIFSEE